MSALSSDPLQRAFAPLIGLPAWSAQKGHGSFLTMEFGEPHLYIREPTASPSDSARVRAMMARRVVRPEGDWHLWIYCCRWRILANNNEIGNDEAPNQEIRAAARELDGQRLIKVEADPFVGTSVFTFDLGGTLLTRPDDDGSNAEQWMLYRWRSDVFTYRADGYYSFGPSNLKDAEKTWLPLKVDVFS